MDTHKSQDMAAMTYGMGQMTTWYIYEQGNCVASEKLGNPVQITHLFVSGQEANKADLIYFCVLISMF